LSSESVGYNTIFEGKLAKFFFFSEQQFVEKGNGKNVFDYDVDNLYSLFKSIIKAKTKRHETSFTLMAE
jgi:hypothetical protein